MAKFSGLQEGLFGWWRRPLALTVLKETAGNGLQLVPEDFRVKTEKGRRGLGNENFSLGIKEMCYKGRAQNPEHRRKGRKDSEEDRAREQRSLEDRKDSIAQDSHMGSDDDRIGEGTFGSAKWQRLLVTGRGKPLPLVKKSYKVGMFLEFSVTNLPLIFLLA